MNNQKARLMLSILMLVALLTVALAWLGVLPSDETASRLSQNDIKDKRDPADRGDAGDEGDEGTAATANLTNPDTGLPLKDLTIDASEIIHVADNSLKKWPAKSSIETLHSVDLADYLGRDRASKPLEGITVFLDPGHGGIDSGATYPAHSSNPEVNESDINLAVAFKTRDELAGLGATVVLIREDNQWLSIFYRIAFTGQALLERFKSDLVAAGYQSSQVNALGPAMDEIMRINSDFDQDGGRGIMSGVGMQNDLRLLLDIEAQYPEILYLSIHCNALEDNDPMGGLQVYYLDNEAVYQQENEFGLQHENITEAKPVYQFYRDAERARLANLIRNGILDEIPTLEYQGLADVQTENYAVLRETNLTSVLIELGFLSSPVDRPILKNSSQQQLMAQAIANAVYQFYCTPD
ncbi:MAG: N-acetylmuramoyl-L-alanine amidase [Eubacteriales bacterium]|nr:N-acetylmuramoyl-L-alanine amidase [Eubacteriales bacterium]